MNQNNDMALVEDFVDDMIYGGWPVHLRDDLVVWKCARRIAAQEKEDRRHYDNDPIPTR